MGRETTWAPAQPAVLWHLFSLMPTAKTAFVLTWTATVPSLCRISFDNHHHSLFILHIYLLLWLIWGTGQEAAVMVEHHLSLIHFILIGLIVYCWLCRPRAHSPTPPLLRVVYTKGAFRHITYFWILKNQLSFLLFNYFLVYRYFLSTFQSNQLT